MDDLSTSLPEASAPELSTQLDTERVTDPAQSQHKETEEPKDAKPESRMDAIKRAAADLEKVEPKAKEPVENTDPKPEETKAPAEETDTKSEPTEEQKAEKVRAEAEQRQKRTPIEPPSKFVPRAKQLWVNVPHEVRSEVARVMSEAEQETAAARESVAEFESVRPFAEMAKQSGTTLDQALGRYVQMEQTLRSDPASGFRGLLQNMGMNPTQAIGHILSAFGVAPERLAQHIQQDPNAYTALAPRPQQQVAPQRQEDPKVAELEQRVAQMQNEHIVMSVVKPFAEENPRYFELQQPIAVILQSGIIEKLYGNLPLAERLAAAYDMADRNSPSAREAAPSSRSEEATETEARAGQDFGGSKSVRGAPASGVDLSTRRRGKMSRSEAINAAMSDLGLAAN